MLSVSRPQLQPALFAAWHKAVTIQRFYPAWKRSRFRSASHTVALSQRNAAGTTVL
jgi:hypothetical protein